MKFLTFDTPILIILSLMFIVVGSDDVFASSHITTFEEMEPEITKKIEELKNEGVKPDTIKLVVFSNVPWDGRFIDTTTFDFQSTNIISDGTVTEYEFSCTNESNEFEIKVSPDFFHTAKNPSRDYFIQTFVITETNTQLSEPSIGKNFLHTMSGSCMEPEPVLDFKTYEEMEPEITKKIEEMRNEGATPKTIKLVVFSNIPWSGSLVDTHAGIQTRDFTYREPITEYSFPCNVGNAGFQDFILTINSDPRFGMDHPRNDYFIQVYLLAEAGERLTAASIGQSPSISFVSGCGGCLIATATYGSHLAPQVQMLRDIRDTQLLTTQSGTAFMNFFNTYYYVFSPTVSFWETQNETFKEFMKIYLTPLIASLSILTFVDMDTEFEVLLFGSSLIILNIGVYIVSPAVAGIKLIPKSKRHIKKLLWRKI